MNILTNISPRPKEDKCVLQNTNGPLKIKPVKSLKEEVFIKIDHFCGISVKSGNQDVLSDASQLTKGTATSI